MLKLFPGGRWLSILKLLPLQRSLIFSRCFVSIVTERNSMLYHVVKAPETLSLINPFLHLTSVYSSSLAGEPHQVGSFCFDCFRTIVTQLTPSCFNSLLFMEPNPRSWSCGYVTWNPFFGWCPPIGMYDGSIMNFANTSQLLRSK